MQQSQSDNRVVLQRLRDIIVVPMPDPLAQSYLVELNGQLLQGLHQNATHGVVLDMGAVATLDANDFECLHRLWKTCTLMGSRLVLSGLQPGTAASLSMLGVNDRWAVSVRTVEQAMEKLQR